MGVLQGRMGADGGLAYRADRGEIIIVDARLTELDVAGLPKRYSKALSKVAARVAQRHFAEVPVYRLDHNDFKESPGATGAQVGRGTGRRGGSDDRLMTEQQRNFARCCRRQMI